MVKVVLFDLDNTLIDFMKFKRMAIEAAIAAMRDAGLQQVEAVRQAIDKIYAEKGIEYQHVFDDALREVLGYVDYKILAAAVVAYRKVKAAYMDTYPGVKSTLRELIKRGYKLGILSDAPPFQMWTRLAEIGLLHEFDAAISSVEFGVRKPNELPFRKALEVFGVKPNEAMMVGDSIDRDIYGAKKLGMVTVLAKYGKGWKDKLDVKPDYEINDIRELLTILP